MSTAILSTDPFKYYLSLRLTLNLANTISYSDPRIMSLITSASTAATTTATTGLITRVLTLVWDYSAGHAFFLINFEDNHESLTIKMNELGSLKRDVERRVRVGEANQLTRLAVVDDWLNRVEALQSEVDVILQEGSHQIEQRCIVDCCPRNWWTCYSLGKKVSKKLTVVADLRTKGNFDIVSAKSLPEPVQVKPENKTVGMDAIYQKTWKLLGRDEVRIMGIYGMGGVGKTTLLKKMNNSFLKIAGNYDVVIWVVVSREFSMRSVQKEIGERLGFTWVEDEDQTKKAEHIFNVLRKKKFVILFDDVWQPIDLEAIGIPSSHTHNYSSKVVFTTRLESVCGGMEANETVRMDVLDPDQAWLLFQQKLGQETLNPHLEIPKLAKEVAEECRGLPLALITVGRAMASKRSPREWKHAIKTLRKYAFEFSGMEEKVLSTLKFSYDSLEDDTVRKCFLYCSLYPEDYEIYKEAVVDHWIGEGFLDDFEDFNDARDKGHDIIGSLEAACLLENLGQDWVKMHDIVRDMALWIACEGGSEKSKYLVQAPNPEIWKDAQRASLIENNDIIELDKAPQCSGILTVMLQRNKCLSRIAAGFFQHMPTLRVLNLRASPIEDVPKSIAGLLQLHFLDLSRTSIGALPDDLGNLVKLQYLNLAYTPNLKYIPGGMIPRFSRLQLLDYHASGVCGDHLSIEELKLLEHLRHLGMSIQQLPTLHSVLSGELDSFIKRLSISKCQGLTDIALGKMKKLFTLQIDNCLDMKELTINEDRNTELLSTLKTLNLLVLPNLKIKWRETAPHLYFKYLLEVTITKCDSLKDTSWLTLAPFLEVLFISSCKELEDVLVDGFARTTGENQSIFSRLTLLSLEDLPRLKSISGVALPFSSLNDVTITGCPLLKKLPFACSNTKRPSLPIRCEAQWWSELQWENQEVKSSFQPSFQWQVNMRRRGHRRIGTSLEF